MKKIALGIIAAFGVAAAQAAPVVTSMADVGGPTAEDMVNSLLSGGSGISVVAGSVSYTGSLGASGTFTNGGTNQANSVGINSGIILTSGVANFVSGVPNTDDFSNNNGASGSALLSGLVGGAATYNASLLSFKFIPDGNKVKFSYVFGSEEYNYYTNSPYNDVFGFIVNGTNYALIGGQPVSVNNVNCGGPVIPDGPSNGVAPHNCSSYRDNPVNAGTIDVELDGLTVVLTFVADVIAGAENTITLGIADVTDGSLDSAVFIQGGSFSTCGGPNQPPCETPEPGSIALAGLGLAALALRRRKSA